MNNPPKIAIVHDWLVSYSGSERVLEQMLHCFPHADLFTLVDFLDRRQTDFLTGTKIYKSKLQNVPFSKRFFRKLILLFPEIIEQFDLSEYDIVISSSHAIAKGVLTGPDQLHICMCYSPMRYAWDLQHQYLKEAGYHGNIRSFFIRRILSKMRIWDIRSSYGVDHFIAISNFISRRISKTYRRHSTVIYPPIDTDAFRANDPKSNFYFSASRFVEYKRLDLIVDAFNQMPDKKIKIVGMGPTFEKCKKLARSNVELLGWQDNETLRRLLRESVAFVFAAEEDFGILPLEAQASGTPVIAYGKGGALETVRDTHPKSGLFFYEQSTDSLVKAVEEFERNKDQFDESACRQNAELFSLGTFRKKFKSHVIKLWNESSSKIQSDYDIH